ncbi:MAG: TerB family tellurite resistance protein [Chryseolinea sp.]
MVIHNSLSDFILFLYVHMSNVDDSYDPRELGTIKGKMNKLFPADMDPEKKLYASLREYNSFDKSKLYELVRDSLSHFKDQISEKESIYADLYEIVQADGQLTQSEAKSLETIRNIIDHHAALHEK